MTERLVTFAEHDVPLEGIEETVDEVIELYGGRITETAPGRITFALPSRRAVRGTTDFECTALWSGSERGRVELSADREFVPSKARAIVLLGLGACGAILAMMWPFFPQMANLSGVGAILAVAVFLLTLRVKPGGIVAELLQRIAESQRELYDRDPDAED